MPPPRRAELASAARWRAVRAAFAVGVAASTGCADGGARSPVVLPATCAVRLPPPAAASARSGGPAPAFVIPRSTIVVRAEVGLGGLPGQLEAKVPRRVVDEKNQDIGIAGRLEVTVDRGPFAVKVDGDALVVETPLKGHARACAKGSCYASCDPEARATARVPLRVGADYKIRSSEVRFDVTRGCQVRVLGGFVTIDVTPMLRARLAQESRRVQASIDHELPDLAPQAARLWTELGKPRALPFGACVVLSPEEITQGPASGTIELAELRFGLLARPEIRARCGDPPPPRPLPPLRDDPALPPAGDVHLGVVLAPDAPARALAGDPALLELGRGRAQVRDAKGDVASGLALDLAGDVCGEATVFPSGASWGDERGVRLTGVSLGVADGERFAAAGLDGAGMGRAVETIAIPVPLAIEQLGTLLPELARGLSDERTSIAASVESSKKEGAGLRGADVVALASLRASLTVRTK